MKRRWFSVLGGGALALLLLSPGTSSAQVLFGLGGFGRGFGFGFPFGGFGYPYMGMGGYGYGGYPVGYNYYMPTGVPSVTYNTTVPMYYGNNPYGGSFMRTAVYNTPMTSPGMATPYYAGPTSYVTVGTPRYSTGVSAAAYSTATNTNANVARIDVKVPASAQIWFDGEPTRQTGRDRVFTTPPLTRGKDYHYEVKAQWTDADGHTVKQTLRVPVHAGDRKRVTFPRSENKS